MIIRNGKATVQVATEQRAERHGMSSTARLSEDGGLTQFGTYIETLQPGSRSSERHWHEQEDELVYMLSGTAILVENDGEHVMEPGDTACWPAGVANAHHLVNRSDSPCAYLIVGTRVTQDVCHYPDSGKTLYSEGNGWRLEDASGTVIKSGQWS
jgi:uncharacterized cupin superfamily protein